MKNFILFLICIFLTLPGCKNPATNVEYFDPAGKRFALLGKITVRSTTETDSKNWTIGCEVLDRDYAVFNNYKEYLAPLGAKTARLQAGWAKCEKKKGQYDFAWLDSIIDYLIPVKIEPWLQLSYGNPIYKGGGGKCLGSDMPSSPEALRAWDNWVKALSSHFKGKINYFEVWNEPELELNNTPEDYAHLFIRTAQIVRSVNSAARLSAIAISRLERHAYVDAFLQVLKKENKLNLIDEITYHKYFDRPEESEPFVDTLKMVIKKYSGNITLKQGESGGLSDVSICHGIPDGTPVTQCKFDLRVMLGDYCLGIPSGVFTIIDFSYPKEGIHMQGQMNGGLIRSDSSKKALEVKPAYYAVQNAIAVFDDTWKKDTSFAYAVDSSETIKEMRPLLDIKNMFHMTAFQNKAGQSLVVYWIGGTKPAHEFSPLYSGFEYRNIHFVNPVLADLITGKIYEIDKADLQNGCQFKGMPVCDYPLVITEKTALLKE